MIAKLQNPIAFGTMSLVVSLGLGVGLCWRTLSTVLVQHPVVQPTQEATELKKRGWDFWTIEVENLATELKEERGRLKKQADVLEQRSAQLATEQKEFAKIKADLEAMRAQIAERIIEVTADESKNLRNLASTYTNLTPKGAVAILREMDDATAVKILSLMKPDIVGPIFEEMARNAAADAPLARRAAQLSEKLRLMKSAKPTPHS